MISFSFSIHNNSTLYYPVGEERSRKLYEIEQSIIGHFGDRRKSKTYGHKHAGIDIRGNYSDNVYPICKGRVIKVFRDSPHRTICIRHFDKLGKRYYSMYLHVEDITVLVGDEVSENTRIGRLFTKKELEESEFHTEPHLHLEIRHSIDDGGDATFNSMSLSELKKYCIDPLEFFNEQSQTME